MTVTDTRRQLQAYDEQLRTEAETASAVEVVRLGPLHLAVFAGGRGFVTYRDLDGADAATIAGWVRDVLHHFDQRPEVTEVEWKTRAHDHAPGLHEALVEHGFRPDEPEAIMIGEARLLEVDVPLPPSVTLRRVTTDADVRAMTALQALVFGEPPSEARVADLLQRLARGDGTELWVAEADGQVVGAGRLEPVAGTAFAGIWGGATLPEWRGRGIYRALTAARARSALALGKTLILSESTRTPGRSSSGPGSARSRRPRRTSGSADAARRPVRCWGRGVAHRRRAGPARRPVAPDSSRGRDGRAGPVRPGVHGRGLAPPWLLPAQQVRQRAVAGPGRHGADRQLPGHRDAGGVVRARARRRRPAGRDLARGLGAAAGHRRQA